MEIPEDQVAMRVTHVSKTFRLPHEKNSSLKSAIIHFNRRDKSYEVQKALRDISFTVKKGEFFGIVGRNGSGKSTLLKMLAGIYAPTKGSIEVRGKLTPFIELGVGFSPELSGRDNVFLNGALLGFNRKEMTAMYRDIVEFAELERFMDQKLKNYSSGMQVRLAFSIAIRARSDILLLDEVLAVGDADFQRKCLRYFALLKQNKKTVVFVSHDMESVRKYCDRVILIEDGLLKMDGTAQEVVPEFMSRFIEHNTDKDAGAPGDELEENRLPLGISNAVSTDESILKIDRVWIEDAGGKEIDKLDDHTKEYFINFVVDTKKAVDGVVPGVIVTNELGEFIVALNSEWTGNSLSRSIGAKEKCHIRFKMENVYEQGSYKISVNVVSKDMETFYAWKNYACSFYVDRPFVTGAKIKPNARVEMEVV